jgi:DNA-binding NtrC family response regulator
MKPSILIADDDLNIIASLKFFLAEEGFEIIGAQKPETVVEVLTNKDIDLILMDMNFQMDTTSGQEGLALIDQLRGLDSEIPIVVMTGWATIDLAIDAFKRGANDFVQKPWNDDALLQTICNQIKLRQATKKVQRLTDQNKIIQAEQYPHLNGIVAESPAMLSLLSELDELAQSDMNILLTGQNGTGKSMLAHYIHDKSPRINEAFVAVNMGAIPDNLFESEMFGHVKGAFTDAKTNRIGRFEIASGGSLFLDEIANIPLQQQAKLLRVLESKTFEKVGASKTQHCDVRIISATNANLYEAINNQEFRQDLFYRLNTIEIRVPCLTEREQDIPALARFFIQQCAKKYHRPVVNLSANAEKALLDYHWPGNVRELGHIIERALFRCHDDTLSAGHLSIPTQALSPEHSVVFQEHETQALNQYQKAPELSLDEIEKQTIISRLAQYDGNVSETAKSLGLSRSGYYRRAKKFDLS